MEDKVLRNYFPAVKFICMAAIAVYMVFMRQTDDWLMSWQVCLLALVLLVGTLYEYGGERRWVFLLLEGILLLAGRLFIHAGFYMLLPFLVMDVAAYLKLKWYFLLIPGLGFIWIEVGQVVYSFICLFGAMLYMQHYIFMARYRNRMERYEQEEYVLKDTIDTNENRVKAQLRDNGLLYEKKMLEERARLSQALHDKLGHSINGSIYQLEACKVLLMTEDSNENKESRESTNSSGNTESRESTYSSGNTRSRESTNSSGNTGNSGNTNSRENTGSSESTNSSGNADSRENTVCQTKNTERSRVMLQNVIDSLRESMDEIRDILRKEKPDRKQTALVQLYGLKDECREKYGIHMELNLKGDSARVSSRQWEVILDNTFEAVTNALKYSGCSRIEVTVLILNKMIRCCISDNGEGCKYLETGMGIEGMKKRVRQINGSLDIHMEEGFSVNMLLPLE